jgi:BirA family biotin operon repressor/biotin-[acetyl-CoA-carboxylase] ligase
VNRAEPEGLLVALLDAYPHTVRHEAFPAAVWQALVARGYGVQSRADGAQLDSDRWFHPGQFAARRYGRFGQRLHAWGVTTSTNSLAQQAESAQAGPATVWVADEQTAGRGRQGRSWLAPRHDCLLFSVQLPVDLRRARHPQILPLGLGVALCEVLESISGLSLQVKWPNDLVSGRRKLGGLLLEVGGAPQPRTILGVGINVAIDAAALRKSGVPDALGLRDAPRCAATCGRAGFREELLADLLHAIEAQVETWQLGRVDALLDAWRRRDALQGNRVRAESPGGIVEGQARGIDDDGRLLVADAQGALHRFSSVEVHLL